MITQTLALLLRHATDDEDEHLRAAARRAGLLWRCVCGDDNSPGHATCSRCGCPQPADAPAAALLVVPLVSLIGGNPVAVYDDHGDAQAAADAVNAAHGEPIVGVGDPAPHNAAVGDPDLRPEHLIADALGKA